MNDAFAGLSAEKLREMLHQMLLIRSFGGVSRARLTFRA